MQLYFNNLGDIAKYESSEWWNQRKDCHKRTLRACRGRPIQSVIVHAFNVYDVNTFYLFKKATFACSLRRHYVMYNRGEPFNRQKKAYKI